MRRRDVIGAMCGVALALPRHAAAQQPGKVWRIGSVVPGTAEPDKFFAEVLEKRLADLRSRISSGGLREACAVGGSITIARPKRRSSAASWSRTSGRLGASLFPTTAAVLNAGGMGAIKA